MLFAISLHVYLKNKKQLLLALSVRCCLLPKNQLLSGLSVLSQISKSGSRRGEASCSDLAPNDTI